MSLIVKAFLERNGDAKAEVRRFSVNPQSVKFDQLIMRLAEIFPSLEIGGFRVSWKDSDGDSISFSSDGELSEAMECVTDGIFRIYLREISVASPSSSSTSTPTEDQELHPNIVCDGCEGQVRGIRYKCIVCSDYDLCSACEAKGIHLEHDMVKMVSPRHSFMGQGMPPHFRQWVRRMRRGREGRGCLPPGIQWIYPHGPPGTHGAPPCPPGPPPCPPGPPPCFPGPHGRGHPGGAVPPPGPAGNAGNAGNEFLANLGQSIASALDPFGISVTYDVGPPCPYGPPHRRCGHRRGWGRCRRRCGGAEGQGQGEGTQPEGEEPMQAEGEEAPSQPQTTPPTEKPPTADDSAERSQDSDDSLYEDQGSGDGRDSLQDWTVIAGALREAAGMCQGGAAVPPATAPPATSTAPTATSTTTAATAPAPAPTPAPTPAPAPAPTPAPAPAPTPAPAPAHPNPEVAKSLQIMLGMGFDNENGWLTRLLESKNGDIMQVLEAIQPDRQSSMDFRV